MLSWVMLFVQAALAVVGLQFLRHGARTATGVGGDPNLTINVFAPLALVGPMIMLVGRIDGSVHGLGWIPIGGPVACGMFALACALIVGNQFDQRITALRPLLLATWVSTGVVMLLVAATHELTLSVGQCAFTLAAVILWLNTPQGAPAGSGPHKASGSGTLWPALALACSLGQGVAALMIDPSLAGYSGALMVTYAAMGVAIFACVCGTTAALSVGGWATVYGVLFAMGIMSLRQLIPMAVQTVAGDNTAALKHVAYGFGAYAPEAALMLALAAAAMSIGGMGRRPQRIGGFTLLVVAAVWCAWRLSAVSTPG